MKVLLNTSFFFSPAVAAHVCDDLARRWVPACRSCGNGPTVCLRMEAEEGIERMAVQTPFDSPEQASRFRSEVMGPMASDMLHKYGADAFTCFSTMMEIVDL